jgi:leader peptidase (prepilin peptidase)/N-methyltransferase
VTSLATYIVALAGVFGLIIGSFLNAVAYRVPAHISLLRESRCPHCDAPVRPWQNIPVVSWFALKGRCANCDAAIAARYPIVEGTTGIAFALVTWWCLVTYPMGSGVSAATILARPTAGQGVGVGEMWPTGLVIVAFLYFAAISILLTLIDLDTHRLPNSIVLPSYLVAGTLFFIAGWLIGDWYAVLRSGAGMAALYFFYFLLRAVRPGGMGGGDVKLAGVIGIYLGWLGWGSLAVGSFAAFLFGGVFGVALLVVRRAGRKTAIPFGPWMILGAWTGVFTGEVIGRWYVNLFVAA